MSNNNELLHTEDGVLNVLPEHDLFTCVKHGAHVSSVGGAGDVVVNLSVRPALVLGQELVHEEGHAVVVVSVLAREFGEAVVADVLHLDLLLEQVPLVEVQDHGGLQEKHVVADVFKKVQSLHLSEEKNVGEMYE